MVLAPYPWTEIRVWGSLKGMKYLLPLLFFSFFVAAQDTPQIDPNTGLPTAGKAEKEEKYDKYLLEALKGITTKNIFVNVWNPLEKLPAETRKMVENQGQLFMKRNRFSGDGQGIDTWLAVRIIVNPLVMGQGRIAGYFCEVQAGRIPYLGKEKLPAKVALFHSVSIGVVPETSDLKTEIGDALDKLALHIFEATKEDD